MLNTVEHIIKWEAISILYNINTGPSHANH